MRSQLKYSYITGIRVRLPVFAVAGLVILTFALLGSFVEGFPFAAHVVGVSLGGVGLGAILLFNVISDIAIAKRVYDPLIVMTPVSRKKTLLASIISMLTLDILTSILPIFGVVVLSLNLAEVDIVSLAANAEAAGSDVGISAAHLALFIVLAISFYLLFINLLFFCGTAKRSFLFPKRASGFLAFLVGIGIFWLVNISGIILAPFGIIENMWGPFFILTPNTAGLAGYIILTLAQAAALFILTGRLIERKINI